MADRWLVDAAGLDDLLELLADQITRGRKPDVPLRLVGVRSRGVPIARRLAARLESSLSIEVPVGAVEITLYRDDLARRRAWPVLRGTDVPFPIDGQEVILVDDVISTGRTARAALNTVCDLGRPEALRLAVVVDRGGRELPIQPDYLGRHMEVGRGEKVVVRIPPVDAEQGIACLGEPE